VTNYVAKGGERGNEQNKFIDIAGKTNAVIEGTITATEGFVVGVQKLGNYVAKSYTVVAEIPILHTVGRLTGALNIANNYYKFSQDWKGNWWNGVEATGQLGFYFFGGAEAELIYNLSTMAIDLTIEGYNYNKGRK